MILLDIDGTLIGDITPQVMVYELLVTMREHNKKHSPPLIIRDFHEKLTDGIIRPYFKVFMNEMEKRNIEVFIYTASEKKWAEHLVKNIEATLSIKFNRPLFTRNHCQLVNSSYTKSIKHVAPHITRALNKKHGIKVTNQDVINNAMVVDNNMVYDKHDSSRVLLCPTYNHKYPENIPSILSSKIYKTFSSVIHEVMASYMSGYKPYKNFISFERQFYMMYVQNLLQFFKDREVSNKDRFFHNLTAYIVHKNITSFNEYTVHYLRKKLNGAKD